MELPAQANLQRDMAQAANAEAQAGKALAVQVGNQRLEAVVPPRRAVRPVGAASALA